MNDLLIHPATLKDVAQAIKSDSSFAIIAPAGYGKYYLAEKIALEALQSKAGTAVNNGLLIILDREEGKQDISIEQVRELIKVLSKKTMGDRLVLIKDAQHLNREAQNALLKILEEPPSKTRFILTISSEDSVLPTILSRTNKIKLRPVGKVEALNFLKDHDQESVVRAWLLSEGAPSELISIVSNSSAVGSYIEDAKAFLRLNRYDRLVLLDKVAKDRSSLEQFIVALSRVVKAAQRASINKDGASHQKLTSARKSLAELSEMVSSNTSPKLVAMALVANLKV